MTRSSKTRLERRNKGGRPKGVTVPLARDRQRFAVAAWWGFRWSGSGPYVAGYWAFLATGAEPIRPERVDELLNAAGVDIKRTASSLDKHVDALVRKAKRSTPNRDWLEASALAIKALVIAARMNNLEVYCSMLDALIGLGWADVIHRLTGRIDAAAKSNVPPFEGKLGPKGRELLAWLRAATPKNPRWFRVLGGGFFTGRDFFSDQV